MTTTLTINGKEYYLEKRNHSQADDRQRTLSVGLTGKTIGQDFTITDRVPLVLSVTILVYINPPRAEFGDIDDIRAAYELMPVTVIDLGVSREMAWRGALDLSRQFSLVDNTAPFPVVCELEQVYA